MAETIINDSTDRISKLPPFIIHHIMSYLSEKGVARTSVLSKRWHNLRRSFPILDFHESYAHFVGEDMACRHRAKYHSILGGKKFRRRVIKFAEFVDVSLLRFCKLGFSMQKFRLLTCLLDVEGASSLLDKWIGLTVKNHVKELDFDVPPRENVMYTLPQIIFLAESVTVLKLAGCKLEQPCNSLRFRSLKRLILKEVHLIEEMLHKLSTECPSLEDLLLFECWGFSRIYFSRACKLKIIYIEESSQETLQSVKVIVPSLQGFTLNRFKRMGSCSIDLTGCSNLNKLSLFQANLMDQDLHCLISNFPLLENLCFSGCDFPNRVSISSHGIKILKFWDCHNITTIDVDTPNLVSFVYSNNSIPISSINVPCPWEISMEHVVAENDTLWFMKLKEFLGVSNQIKDMRLYVKWDDEDLRAIDEFRNSLTSVPSEVGELSLRIIRGPLSSRAAWLDGLFGHFYSRNLKVPVINEADAKFVEWLYKEMMNRDFGCCNSNRIKCWRHYLKNFKIVAFLKPRGYNNTSVNIDDLMDLLPGTVVLHLDWSFPQSV